MGFFFGIGIQTNGLERRLLATCRWHVATAVAFPQKSESISLLRRSYTLRVWRNGYYIMRRKPYILSYERYIVENKGDLCYHSLNKLEFDGVILRTQRKRSSYYLLFCLSSLSLLLFGLFGVTLHWNWTLIPLPVPNCRKALTATELHIFQICITHRWVRTTRNS